MSSTQSRPGALRTALNPDRRRVVYGFVAAIALFVIGDIPKPGFASASGVQQILQVSSFVGLVAAGQTFVILVGGIDLSVPWVLNAAAIVLVSQSVPPL
jgi:ribose transport system permease protein